MTSGWWSRRIANGVPPMVWREMRMVMRGKRAPLALCACSFFAVAAGGLIILFQLAGPESQEQYAEVGRRLFEVMVALEVGIVLFLTPALTAGTVAREYQLGTIDNLLLTPLTGRAIAYGKLVGAVGFVMVALFCTMPVLAVAFFFGGVSLSELLVTQVLLLGTAWCFGAFGIYCSAQFRAPSAALIVITVGGLFALAALPLLSITPFIAEVIKHLKSVREESGAWALSILAVVYALVFIVCGGPIIVGIALAIISLPSPLLALALLFFPALPFSWFWWLLAVLTFSLEVLIGRYLLLRTGAVLRSEDSSTYKELMV